MVIKFLKRNILTILTLLASLALIIIGISGKQYEEVLTKAVNVCLECIGIG